MTDEPDLLGALQASLDRARWARKAAQRCRCTEIHRPHYYGDHPHPTFPAEPPQADSAAVGGAGTTPRGPGSPPLPALNDDEEF